MTLRRLAALGLVLSAVAGCVGGGSEGETFDTAAIIRQAGPAPWSGTGVLRAEWAEGRIVEWLDRRTGATRSVDHGGTGRYIVLQDGHRILGWSEPSGGASLAEIVHPHDPRLDGAAEILSYWHKLNRGAARIVGEGDVDGRPVWIVEVERAPGGDAPPDLEIFAEVDRSTFLPMRVRTESEQDDDYTSVRTVAYSEPARVSRQMLFSFRRGSMDLDRNRRLRYADLAFVPFPVYAPAPRVGDLTYSTASTYQETDGRSTLFLSYVRGENAFAEPAITLSQSHAPGLSGFPSRGVRVSIAGAVRRVRLTKDGQIWVLIGDTLIHGRTTLSSDDRIRFLRALRPR
jgi:hypothetical protein